MELPLENGEGDVIYSDNQKYSSNEDVNFVVKGIKARK
jgi:hypothetical protein